MERQRQAGPGPARPAGRPAPSAVSGDTRSTPAPEAEDTEAFLLAACRRLLDQPDLTPADNFTDAGGTSLAVARLVALLESTYPVRVKAAEVMRQPDLAALAALVAGRRAVPGAQLTSPPALSCPPPQPGKRERPLPRHAR